MSCLMRAFAHCNTETTWAQDFFFLSSVFFFFFYVRVSRALITITSQRNQFPRLGQSASGHLSISSASFPVIFLRKRRARWQFAASKLKPERGMVSLQEFEARWTKKGRKIPGSQIAGNMWEQSECSLCFTSQQSRNKRCTKNWCLLFSHLSVFGLSQQLYWCLCF